MIWPCYCIHNDIGNNTPMGKERQMGKNNAVQGKRKKQTLILINSRYLLCSSQKWLLIPGSEPVGRLGEAQNTHSDFTGDILRWTLRTVNTSGGVITQCAKRKASPAPTDAWRNLARTPGLPLKGSIVPVLTKILLSSFCNCEHEH